ncbi:AraC family transcriptional regulator [Xanthomonas sp. A2111]|uniref:AraC family transcriptional regulator n=1 Tax=Xanthomonas hawaiiensis TaxID=3003247 RepID=A0ABU2I3V3_9XANT|nr:MULTISPECIES: AraC family transcriptional regulator [unclassified Xanthomonas]MBO9826897.1 AraC family transcriptional regulator [Xanthomonas sp. A2111]MBO9873204.1 AraC family transcriptional regulator [Xanthomonas sp. D-93]MDS9992835.1 AraC family transcriptional regulator [Xanthomonas sp. A2111]
MHDPLSDVVRLLHPRAVFANLISGKGRWAVRYAAYGQPGFCIVLEGGAVLAVDGHPPIAIGAGDFVLLPTTPAFTLSGVLPAPPVFIDPQVVPGGQGELRHGEQGGAPDMLALGGAFLFDSANAGLLVSLLPAVVHVQGAGRLMHLVRMVGEEYQDRKPGNDYMLSRLVQMLLVEAMRWTSAGNAPPGLLRGLGDARLAPALTQIHARIDHAWTVGELARMAALSRSTFFERFARTVGVAPMAYVLAWRMQVAKDLLRRDGSSVADVAQRVGYGSTSSFSVAFSRHTGEPPSRYARR